jgi:hypothetical protein
MRLRRQADAGTRTPDPLLTMEVLYQLSYVGVTLRIVAPRGIGAPAAASAGSRSLRYLAGPHTIVATIIAE